MGVCVINKTTTSQKNPHSQIQVNSDDLLDVNSRKKQ